MSRRDPLAASGPALGPAAGRWLWLFPAVFAAHIAEESLAGERFYRWIRRATGREIGPGTFVAVNLAFEAAMVSAVRRATRPARPAGAPADSGVGAWVAPALGLIGTANGLGHLAGSVVTRSYSPGAVSGACLWAPLGLVALRRSRRALPRHTWRRGVVIGALAGAGVMPLALALSHHSPAAGESAAF